jgi:Tfp pilus assembly protein PilN
MLLAQMTPEDTKNIAVVTVMLAAIAGALLYPIARAFARRLEGNGNAAALQRELAEVHARLDALQQGESRMAELEARLDFAERMLTRQRDAESLRLPGA